MKNFLSLVLLILCIFQIKSNNASKIKKFAESKIGCCYVFGATGEKMSKNVLKNLIVKYGKDKIDAKVAQKYYGKHCYDNSGFVVMALNCIGIKLNNEIESILGKIKWEQKGKIDKLPKEKVCLLFKGKNLQIETIGIYLGDGNFVYSKEGEGVVKQKLEEFKWTHWGIPEGLY